MRNPSLAFAQALATAPQHGLVPRRLLYVRSVSRDDEPQPRPVGFWTGDRPANIPVRDGQTGANATYPFIGMGQKLKIPVIPRVSELKIQTLEVQLSQIDTSVQFMFLQNNCRFARVDIHEALFDPTTKLIVGSELVFIGEVDGDPAVTIPEAGGEGNVTMQIVSYAIRTLTTPNPKRRSSETLKQRNPIDSFGAYSNATPNMRVQWGEGTAGEQTASKQASSGIRRRSQ